MTASNEPSAPSQLTCAARMDSDSHFVLPLCLPSPLVFLLSGQPRDEFCYHKTGSVTTMARGRTDKTKQRQRGNTGFSWKQVILITCQASGGTSVERMCPLSVLSGSLFPDRVFIWQIQTCRLGMPLYPSRVGGGVFSASVFQAVALYSVLQNPNTVSLSTPSWWLLLSPPLPPFNYKTEIRD